MGCRAGRYWACGLVVGLLAMPGLAAIEPDDEFERGKALYENHCTSCHDARVHTRDTRRVLNRGDLQLYVSTWSYHAQLGWSREEIIEVTDYLDRVYYRFAAKP